MIRIEGIGNRKHEYLIVDTKVANVSRSREEEIINSFFVNIFNKWGFCLTFTPISENEKLYTRLLMIPAQDEQLCLIRPEREMALVMKQIQYNFATRDLARMDQQKIINFLFDH